MYQVISIRDSKLAFDRFEQCADEAPNGAYKKTKEVRELIGDTVDQFIRELRALDMQADNCDRARAVEALLYLYVKESNPEMTELQTAEGFGEAMQGPSRERVFAQTLNDVAALARTQAR
jgi:hypothetical protein